MHEFSIAQNILDTVYQNIDKNDIVSRIIVEIGSFSGIDKGSLEFCFGVIKAETSLKRSRISVNIVDTVAKCKNCGNMYTVNDYFFICPECDSTEAEIVRGDKIILKSIEVDDNEQ